MKAKLPSTEYTDCHSIIIIGTDPGIDACAVSKLPKKSVNQIGLAYFCPESRKHATEILSTQVAEITFPLVSGFPKC